MVNVYILTDHMYSSICCHRCGLRDDYEMGSAFADISNAFRHFMLRNMKVQHFITPAEY